MASTRSSPQPCDGAADLGAKGLGACAVVRCDAVRGVDSLADALVRELQAVGAVAVRGDQISYEIADRLPRVTARALMLPRDSSERLAGNVVLSA